MHSSRMHTARLLTVSHVSHVSLRRGLPKSPDVDLPPGCKTPPYWQTPLDADPLDANTPWKQTYLEVDPLKADPFYRQTPPCRQTPRCRPPVMHAKPTPNPPSPTRPSCGQTNTCKNIRILRSRHYKFNFKVDISPDLQNVDTSIICGITEKSGY